MRVFATLLIAALAMVPPGICMCRLSAALAPAQEVPCPEDSDHECDCPQLKHDCTVESAAASVAPPMLALGTVANDQAVAMPAGAVRAHVTSSLDSTADPPLYLTLRAWRI